MNREAVKLEDLLREEIVLYNKLCRLEEKKSESIIEKNWKMLQSLSAEQELLLSKLTKLESGRKSIVEKGFGGGSDTSLREIAGLQDENSSQNLLSLGSDLKHQLKKIKMLHETNIKLLSDNMEYYKILISGIKGSITENTGYSQKGTEESRVTDSLVFNRKI